ncbi:MAG: hypothetical protein H0T84_08380 [Tatlockia sp.]|nr:hypothetical protein [Tatlockia sp.]
MPLTATIDYNVEQFQISMAARINKAFGTTFSLKQDEDFNDAFSESDAEEADIVIVGGGPIGFAQALGFKKQNPKLKIVVLEKYNEFTRKHTLVMQAKHLESFMEATESKGDPRLIDLLQQLKKSPNIRTNKLQETFRAIAEKAGVITVIETVDGTTIDQQILKYKPKLVIGADGTHSVVSDKLFPKGNQIKHEIDFAMQVRYEVEGDAESNWEEDIKFYQTLARQGLVAFEQVGRRDDQTGKTPVTVQLIIPKEDFEILKTDATAKNPIKPFSRTDLKADLIPDHLKKFITAYFAEKVKITKDPIELESIRVSVNELPATRANKTATVYKGVAVCLNGDAALGLSYFKGLNAGLEALGHFFTLLKPAIKQGLTNKGLLIDKLRAYQGWFSPYANKKVKEVEDYSFLKIRTSMKLVEIIREMKMSSRMEFEGDQRPVIDTFYHLHARAKKNERVEFDPYPHRSYDPNIKLGEFAYVPISYTFKKIAKLFLDYFKPYKSDHQIKEDFKQPLSGVVNLFVGLAKIVWGVFTLNVYRFGDGLASTLRGVIEIGTTPLAWTLKFIIRDSLTEAIGQPKIEESNGMHQLVNLGEELLENQEDDDFSFKQNTSLVRNLQ